MTFSLSLSLSDLLLMLPEIMLTLWVCAILAVDFAWPKLPKIHIASLSVLSLVSTLACLIWLDLSHVTGALFRNMFVLDRMAIFFKIFIVAATLMVVLASIEEAARTLADDRLRADYARHLT